MHNAESPTLTLFGLRFLAVDLERAAEVVAQGAAGGAKGLVVTPNVDHVVLMHRDALVRKVYEEAKWVVADGMPIVWLSRMRRGSGLPARVTGADLLPRLCAVAAQEGLKVFFCGGMPGVAEQLVTRLLARHPRLQVMGVYSPPVGFERDADQTRRLIECVNAAAPDILFLGLGTPKQEIWAHQHLSELQTGPVVCVGGAFDLVGGLKRRAPRIFQEAGLEWLWRLSLEPGRLWRRYLVRDLTFLLLAARELARGQQ